MRKTEGPGRSRQRAIASDDTIIAQTTLWLERAVIGLNLCPFAQSAHLLRRIRFAVTAARTRRALRMALAEELRALEVTDASEWETTLLIHPRVLVDFTDYNAFLEEADEVLRLAGLEGVFQIASFHPQYRFGGTTPEDITNYTNRCPYPMLHLLREESVERAASPRDAAGIVKRNLATLRRLGSDGWRQLGIPGPMPAGNPIPGNQNATDKP